MIKNNFIKYVVNPIGWSLIKGSKRFKYYKQYEKKQWNSPEKQLEEQKKNLYNLVSYAHKKIPYYQKIIKNKKITYSQKTILEDIKKFPILTKQLIRENFNDLINPNIKAKRNTSGGSTGEQVILMQDKSMSDHNAATKVLYDEWAGKLEGDLLIKLWGSESDVLKGSMGFKGFLVKNLTNTIILNAYKMSEKNMREYIDIINKLKPKLILSYVQSAFEISRYINENNIKVYSPKSFMTSAGTLSPHMEIAIEKAFNCKTFNRYGSREVGDMACECEKHEGLHINLLTQHLEILDDTLKPVNNEDTGEIYITYLHNYAMPLIRYKIGDRASFSNKKCSCGRSFPLLKEISGRVGCTLKTKKGALDSTALTTSFYFYESIRKYQLRQKGEEFLIKVVIDPKKDWETDKKNLKSKLEDIFGEGTKFTFEVVDEIEPSKSGKYLYLINENEFNK